MRILYCSECGIRLTGGPPADGGTRCTDCVSGIQRRHMRHGDSGMVERASLRECLKKTAAESR